MASSICDLLQTYGGPPELLHATSTVNPFENKVVVADQKASVKQRYNLFFANIWSVVVSFLEVLVLNKYEQANLPAFAPSHSNVFSLESIRACTSIDTKILRQYAEEGSTPQHIICSLIYLHSQIVPYYVPKLHSNASKTVEQNCLA